MNQVLIIVNNYLKKERVEYIYILYIYSPPKKERVERCLMWPKTVTSQYETQSQAKNTE